MTADADLRYTKDHEWVRVDGDEATVGITAYAADQLGDIVFVELPGAAATLEAVRSRSASSSRSRRSATCSRRSPARSSRPTRRWPASPELVNSDPYGEGWMIRVRPRRAGRSSTTSSTRGLRRA